MPAVIYSAHNCARSDRTGTAREARESGARVCRIPREFDRELFRERANKKISTCAIFESSTLDKRRQQHVSRFETVVIADRPPSSVVIETLPWSRRTPGIGNRRSPCPYQITPVKILCDVFNSNSLTDAARSRRRPRSIRRDSRPPSTVGIPSVVATSRAAPPSSVSLAVSQRHEHPDMSDVSRGRTYLWCCLTLMLVQWTESKRPRSRRGLRDQLCATKG